MNKKNLLKNGEVPVGGPIIKLWRGSWDPTFKLWEGSRVLGFWCYFYTMPCLEVFYYYFFPQDLFCNLLFRNKCLWQRYYSDKSLYKVKRLVWKFDGTINFLERKVVVGWRMFFYILSKQATKFGLLLTIINIYFDI